MLEMTTTVLRSMHLNCGEISLQIKKINEWYNLK